MLGYTHAELSGEALAAWNLPEPIQSAVRHHHIPEGGDDLTLGQLIHVADEYLENANRTECLAALGLGAKLDRILGEYDSELRGIQGLFS